MDIKSFAQTFGKPELKAILSRWKGILLLVLVVLVSFWSIGFSNGSEKYLKAKMDSPFVKFLGVEIPYVKAQTSEFIDTLSAKLQRPIIKDRFQISKFSYVSYWTPYFASKEGKNTLAIVRAINVNDDLYKFIYNNDLIISPTGKRIENAEWSMIVTSRYLKKLGYREDDYPAYLNYQIGFAHGDVVIPIPVAAVVNQLPNDCDIFVTWKLYEAFVGRYGDSNPLYPDQLAYSNLQRFFIPNESEASVKQKISSKSQYSIQPQDETYAIGVIIERAQSSDGSAELTNLRKDFGQGVIEVYNFNSVGYSVQSDRSVTYDNIIIQFEDLDKINEFEAFMLEKPLGLTIDMNVIEARNNFLLFSKISRVLAVILSLLSIGFIITFLTRTITEHIDRNAKNLGTLKAFGLANKSIAWTYFAISGVLVVGIFIVAMGLVLFIGEPLTNLILNSIGVELAQGETMFLLEIDALMLGYFILLPIFLITATVYLKIRKQTPGDLIYER